MVPRGRDIYDAGLALDHDGLGFRDGTGDEGYAACLVILYLGADPFGAGASLSETSSGEYEPGIPVAFGRHLGFAGVELPSVLQPEAFRFVQ